MFTSIKRAVAPVLVGAAAVVALCVAPPAHATTLTCTHNSSATTSPFGCGGLQSAGTVHGTLDLAHTSNVYNALVTVQGDTGANTNEDWTAFALNGSTTGGPGGLGEYVAMDTPNGRVHSFTVSAGQDNPADCSTTLGSTTTFTNAYPCPGEPFTAGPGTFCLSVEHATIAGKYRWFAVLRNCSTNGTFYYGTQTHPGSVSFSFANFYQVWAPLDTGDQGLAFTNVFLRSHNHNVDHLLNIQGNGGAGARVLAWPETGTAPLWEQWDLIGCTPPASQLGVPSGYVSCP